MILIDREQIERRIDWLLDELKPLYQHPDITISPTVYDPQLDTIYCEVHPRSEHRWAEIAYKFGTPDGMKYDRDSHVFGIDGQPRVSYSGLVWVRYISDFEDGSKAAFHILSVQPSHTEAEHQLTRLYGLFRERNGLEPIEVFRKFL